MKKAITLLLFLSSLALLFNTLEDIGVTIDEPYKNRPAAKLFVSWLEIALSDILQGNWYHFSSQKTIEEYFHPPYVYHPPFARLLVGITWRLFHDQIGELKALRLAPAFLFSLNIALLFHIVARYFSPLAGLIASLGLLLIPATYGHAHLIALDSPIASMWFLTVYCFVRGLEDGRWSIMLGIVWGLALNTKIHAYFIPVPLLLWAFLFCRERVSNNLFAMFFLSPLIVILTNPYLWHDTIYNWFSFLSIYVKRRELFAIPTYFLGSTYDYSAPWYYPFFMLIITTPPTILLLAILGIIMALVKGRQGFSPLPNPINLSLLFLFNTLAPLVLVAAKSAPTYDGVRLFLPAYPFLAGLAGMGFHHLILLIKRIFPTGHPSRLASMILALLALIPAAYSLQHIHPYELSYFNLIIGGIRGAWRAGLEVTYWNDPFNPSFVRFLNRNFAGKTFRPDMANDRNFNYYHELGWLRRDIRCSYDDYDYVLLAFRQGFFDAESWFYAKYVRPLYQVEVDGVSLLAIYPPLSRLGQEPGSGVSPPLVLRPQAPEGGSWKGLLKVVAPDHYWLGVLTREAVEVFIDKEGFLRLPSSPEGVFREAKVSLGEGFHLLEVKFLAGHPSSPLYLGWRTDREKLGIVSLAGAPRPREKQ